MGRVVAIDRGWDRPSGRRCYGRPAARATEPGPPGKKAGVGRAHEDLSGRVGASNRGRLPIAVGASTGNGGA
jgi:hypothetical protein